MYIFQRFGLCLDMYNSTGVPDLVYSSFDGHNIISPLLSTYGMERAMAAVGRLQNPNQEIECRKVVCWVRLLQ